MFVCLCVCLGMYAICNCASKWIQISGSQVSNDNNLYIIIIAVVPAGCFQSQGHQVF